MGQVKEQVRTSTLPKMGEPVFESSYSSHISITQIEVKGNKTSLVEKFLTDMIPEFWRCTGLKDIKVLKSHGQPEFLVITSWDVLGISANCFHQTGPISVAEKLGALVKAGTIRIVENKQDNYLIIE